MISRKLMKIVVIDALNEWDKTHEGLFYEDVPEVAGIIVDKIMRSINETQMS